MKFCQKTLPQTLAQNFGKQEKTLDFYKWGLKVEYKFFYKSALKLFFGVPYPLNNCRNFFANFLHPTRSIIARIFLYPNIKKYVHTG